MPRRTVLLLFCAPALARATAPMHSGWTSDADAAVNADVSVAAVGDANGDGAPDLLVTAYDSGELSVLLFAGDGVDADATHAWSVTLSGLPTADRAAALLDVNDDGYADLALGIARERVEVWYGGPAGYAATSDAAATGVDGDELGAAVAGAGDVDGDGVSDLVVGAPGAGVALEGAVFAWYGSAAGLSASADWTALGGAAGRQLGGAVAGAGDVDGDGYADVVVGAPLDGDGDAGSAWLYGGGATGLGGAAAWSYAGASAGGELGRAVVGLGDADGDGYDDIALSGTGDDGSGARPGEILAFYGDRRGLGDAPIWSTVGATSTSDLGASLAAGDLDGDGFADLVAGAPGEPGGSDGEGLVAVWTSGARGLTTPAWVTFGSGESGARLGANLAVADLDGDGDSDVYAAEPGWATEAGAEGRVRAWTADADGLVGPSPVRVRWEGTGLGAELGAAGDVNGDGLGDVLVRGDTAGFVGVYLGADAGLGARWEVASAGPVGGCAAADVDDDGLGDLLIGRPDGDAVDVWLGGASGMTASWSWSGDAATGFGVAVGIGDVDGDGALEALVGADGGAGALVIMDALDAGATAVVFPGAQDGARFGATLAVGDYDGDGYDDVVVAAPDHDAGGVEEGRLFLYRGGPDGLEGEPAWEWSSGVAGVAVAAGGDVNGDGAAELWVLDATAARLFLGGAAGLGDRADWEVAGATAGGAAGDVDGDGFDDVVVSVEGVGVSVYRGSAVGLDGVATWSESAVVAPCAFGRASRGVGDVDGDGLAEVGVGAACATPGGESAGALYVYGFADADGDGVRDADDCNDTDATAVPGAVWVDADGDGHGDPARPATACPGVAGYALVGDDCDDADADVSPTAPERCDGVDDDCDGVVDEPDAIDVIAWEVDADGDGYGDPATAVLSCAEVAGHVALGGDCDDADPAIHPDAAELCDLVDSDCDGLVDEPDALDATVWYTDADLDTFGDPLVPVPACEMPPGVVADGTDCDDADADIHPGAPETCDGVDEDCDGAVDEDAVDAPTWYQDLDHDGAGDAAVTLVECDPPGGYAAVAGDCDDMDPDVIDCGDVDTGVEADDTAVRDTGSAPPAKTGCGCAGTMGAPSAMGWGLLALAWRRRGRAG